MSGATAGGRNRVSNRRPAVLSPGAKLTCICRFHISLAGCPHAHHVALFPSRRFLPDYVRENLLLSLSLLFTNFVGRASLEESNRKAAKSRNTNGNPIKLQSKILAVAADPVNSGSIYVAESAGTVRRVILEVGARRLACWKPRKHRH